VSLIERAILFVFLLGCEVNLLHKAIAEPAPLEAYAALPDTDHVRISPDGTRLALLSRSSGSPVVVVISLQGDQLGAVDASELKPRNLYFATNDIVIISASDYINRVLTGEQEYWFSFVYDVTTDKVHDLLQQEGRRYVQLSTTRPLAYSTDGENAYVWGIPRSGAFRWSVLKTRYDNPKGDLVLRLSTRAIDAFVSADGTIIAHEEFDPEAKRYEVIGHTIDGTRSLRRLDGVDRARSNVIGVHPDGNHLIYYASKDEDVSVGYYLMSLEDGTLKDQVFNKPGLDVSRTITDKNRVVVGVEYASAQPVYEFLDERLDRVVQAMVTAFPNGSVFLESWSDDFSKMIFRVEGEGMVGDYFLFDVEAMETTFLATQRPGIPADQTQPVEVFRYEARDGLEIEAILTGAPVEGAPAKPLILMPHGGPASRDKVEFDWMAQFLASRGYVVMQPNFRGSTGYGLDFREAGHGEWGKAMQTDLTDGALALAAAGRIDPERVCIIGASYGGYAALMGGVTEPDLFKCVAAIAPVTDPAFMLRTLRDAGGADSPSLAYWKEQLGTERISARLLRGQSPVALADQIEAPVLLLHGDEDLVVDIEHSERMDRALRQADKSVSFVTLEGEDHWLSRTNTRMQLLRELEDFLGEHLHVE